MNWRKILGWLVVIFLVWFLVTNPAGAAAAVNNVLDALKNVGSSLATFVTSL